MENPKSGSVFVFNAFNVFNVFNVFKYSKTLKTMKADRFQGIVFIFFNIQQY